MHYKQKKLTLPSQTKNIDYYNLPHLAVRETKRKKETGKVRRNITDNIILKSIQKNKSNTCDHKMAGMNLLVEKTVKSRQFLGSTPGRRKAY